MKIKIKKDHDYIALRKEAKDYIDRMAEFERDKYATSGYHQSHVYTAKYEEAVRFNEKGEDDYPYNFLKAELGTTGIDLGSVAQAIINAHNLWTKRMADIEKIRINRKKMVDVCEDDFFEIKKIAENANFSL